MSIPVDVFINHTANQHERDGVLAGALELYIYGIITYRDVFGLRRTTKFRFRKDRNSLSLRPDIEGNFSD